MKEIRNYLFLFSIGLLLSAILIDCKPIEVNQDNWENLLATDEWMVEFYAPWCPACNRFEPVWNEFSSKSQELNIKVGAADVNSNPILSGLFSVTSLPTVYHIKDGQYRIYNGNRELNNLIDFIKNKEWTKVEPSSSWLKPNSFLIKSLSLLFKLTLYFKDIYTELTEKQGYPTWAVLSIFVVATIVMGLLLGVLLILFIDCICPPKKYTDLKDDEKDDIVDDSAEKTREASKDKEQKTDGSPDKPVKRRNVKSKRDD